MNLQRGVNEMLAQKLFPRSGHSQRNTIPRLAKGGSRNTPCGAGEPEDYSFSNSRRRLVCVRETGISLARLSFILSMKLDLNQGTTSLMCLMLTR